MRAKLAARLKQCGLELHPEKTKVAYRNDANRQGCHPNEKFDVLGYTFRTRKATGRRGIVWRRFSPAISKKAEQKIRDEIRGWKLHRCTGQSIGDLARKINSKLRGWFNDYKRFTPSALRPIERHVGQSLVRLGLSEIQETTQSPESGMGLVDGRYRSSAGPACGLGAPA